MTCCNHSSLCSLFSCSSCPRTVHPCPFFKIVFPLFFFFLSLYVYLLELSWLIQTTLIFVSWPWSRSSSYSPMTACIFLRIFLVTLTLYEMFVNLHLPLLLRSTLHSKYYTQKMNMTRKRSHVFTFDARHFLLTVLTGFSFVKDVAACAILEITSGLQPSFDAMFYSI